jgi:acyl-CoA synthetase (AMP-forming)/AMP-acid ligase II/NAD(P)-dependent dehydrogenase (short-subunit alcohol dehydrogenase family)/acyl carrier protein
MKDETNPQGTAPPPKADEGAFAFPVSSAQRRMWFLARLAPENPFYNVPLAYRFQGRLDAAILQRSLDRIVARHELLKTVFATAGGIPVQLVRATGSIRLNVVELPSDCPEPELERRATEEARRPFDLARGPLARATLFRLAPDDEVLLFVMHHILVDGWAVHVFFSELAELYAAESSGRMPVLEELAIQYADYSVWEEEWLQGAEFARQLAYWSDELRGTKQVLLPRDVASASLVSFEGGAVPLALSPETTSLLKKLHRSENGTLFMVLLAAVELLLHRLCGQDDIRVATAIANREQAELRGLIGFFANTLLLRGDLSGNPTFRELLAQARRKVMAAMEHQSLPFDKLVEALQPERTSSSMTPLFEVVFALQDNPRRPLDLAGCRGRPYIVTTGWTKTELEWLLWEEDGGIAGAMVYSRELFSEAVATGLARRFERLVEDVAREPDRLLSAYSILSEQERAAPFLQPEARAPGAGVHPLRAVETWAEREPERIAVRCGGQSLDFAALRERSLRVAGELRAHGLAPRETVALFGRPSIELVVALLGSLEAGAAVLLVSPDAPAVWQSRLLAESGARYVLGEVPAGSDFGHMVHISLGLAADRRQEVPPMRDQAAEEGEIICPSGASFVRTTMPALAAELGWLHAVMPLSPGNRVLTCVGAAQRASVWPLLFPLVQGATLVIADGSELASLLERDSFDVLHVTPRDTATLPVTLLRRGQVLVMHGDGLGPAVKERLRELGTTSLLVVEEVEGAGIALHRKGPAGQVVEQSRGGRPAVCAVAVHDRYQQPAPNLVIGELVCRSVDDSSRALGMRGRRRGDEIEITGFSEDLAVIHGHMVHLAVVEEVLRQHGDVLDCAVMARTGPHGVELVAYVVPVASTTAAPLRKHAQSLLPPSHWPQAYALLTALPLRPDGRVDAEALARIPVVDAETMDSLAAQIRRWDGVQGVEIREQRWRDAPAPVSAEVLLPAPPRHPQPGPGGSSARGEPSARVALASGDALDMPADAPRTLAEALTHAARGGARRGVRYWTAEGEERFESYAALVERARRVTGGLQRSGLAPGALVLLQLEDGWEFFAAFWGCVLGGLVPVPLSPVWSQPGNAARLATVWRFLDAPPVVTSRAGEPAVQDVAREHGLALAPMIVEELLATEPGALHADTAPDDLALLLLTSGSTGLPKAVIQTHRALLCRSHAYALHDHASADDVIFNWMPLDHVGGLVMMSLQAVYLGATQVQAPMRTILAEPLRWLDGLAQTRATVSWAPNFAFGLLNDHADEIRRGRWDLGAVRRLQNGGEAVVARSARRFLELLEPHGLRPDAIGPAWGMSETCSGVTYERSFTRATTSDEQPHVSVGEPVPGASLRIVDDGGEPLREGQAGQLEVHGVMVTRGYLRNDEQNRESFTADGWFRTGDLAVLEDGKLTITGRAKDVIIINGINYAAHEIESVVEELPEVQPSFTAACSVRSPGSDTDELAVFFVPRDHEDVDEIISAIRERVRNKIGISPRRVIPLARDEVPKTEIGKIQRSALRLRFADKQQGHEGDVSDAAQAGPPGSVPPWFFRRTWRTRVRSAPAQRGHRGGMLVFCDESGLGDELLRRCAGARSRCVRVTVGSQFRVVADDHFEIDPACLDHYRRVFDEVGSELEVVLHLWSYGPVRDPDWRSVQSGLERGALSLHLAARALAARSDELQRRLYAISSHAAEVAPGDRLCAERLASVGLLQTISSELPWLATSLVDLEGTDRARDADCVLRELGLTSPEPEVAYRSGQRHSVYLEPVNLGRLPADPVPLQRRDVEGEICLVTGGLGGLGVQVAERLWRQYGLKLLLVGRTTLPPRSEWESHLDTSMPQDVAARIRHHAHLERAGAPFVYRSVDVSDLGALERCIGEAEEALQGRLGCIVHLAGVGNLRKHWLVADQHRIAVESRETFDWMFAPKVQGGWNVARIADERRLPLVLFSSINAFFGGATFSAYSAANGFLEGLAVERRWRRPDLATYCLTWSIWDGLGMSEGNPERLQEISRALGHRIVEVRPGLDSLCALLHRTPQSILVGLDPEFRRRLVMRAERPLLEPVAEVTAAPGSRLDSAAAAPDRFGDLVHCRVVMSGRAGGRSQAVSLQAPRTPMEELVARAWEAVLGRAVDSVNQNFFDAGGTSLQTAQLQAHLRKMVGVEIPVVELFRHATIAALARHIVALRRGAEEGLMPAAGKAATRTERQSGLSRLRTSRQDHRGKPGGKPAK